MPWTDLIYAGALLASTLAAVVAWLARLRWAKEYRAAKDATIRAKDAQIAALEAQLETLRELTPMQLHEYFVSVKAQLEAYNETLKQQVAEKDRQIAALRSGDEAHRAEAARLESEKLALLERRRVTSRTSAEAEKLLATFSPDPSDEDIGREKRSALNN